MTTSSTRPRKRRSEKTEERRAAIIEAAIVEFIANGFAATRIDDIARRAGVAKGTVYLHFADKEALFKGVVQTEIAPVGERLRSLLDGPQVSLREAVELGLTTLLTLARETRIGDVLRLIIAEATRFPRLAEDYFAEIIAPTMGSLRAALAHAVERGDLANPAIAQYPQLVMAPALVGIIWQAVFQRLAPLDAVAMVHAHLDTLFVQDASKSQ